MHYVWLLHYCQPRSHQYVKHSLDCVLPMNGGESSAARSDQAGHQRCRARIAQGHKNFRSARYAQVQALVKEHE
eukprot:6077647-Lingulodinium_polyedra.AAC.1